MKKIIFIVTLLIVLGCSSDLDKNSESCYLNTNPLTIIHDNIEREYVMYIPDSYSGNSPVPLMFNFHGFAGSASYYMTDADMRSLAESETFILVYPQGSCSDGFSVWNPCPVGGDNKISTDDVGFVESIITEISSQYNIDMERVYAAGYSNGGMMAYGLANYKSELIAAVASISGVMLDCTIVPSHPMPVVHLHGTSDSVIPYNGNIDYNSVQSVLDYWIDLNNTTTTPIMKSDNSGGITIEHYVYNQGDNNVAVEHYKYIEGGHVWFKSNFKENNTAKLVWDFVSKYDINGLR